jgi:hypothetical protein
MYLYYGIDDDEVTTHKKRRRRMSGKVEEESDVRRGRGRRPTMP